MSKETASSGTLHKPALDLKTRMSTNSSIVVRRVVKLFLWHLRLCFTNNCLTSNTLSPAEEKIHTLFKAAFSLLESSMMIGFRIVEGCHDDTIGEFPASQGICSFLWVYMVGKLHVDLPYSLPFSETGTRTGDFQTDDLKSKSPYNMIASGFLLQLVVRWSAGLFMSGPRVTWSTIWSLFSHGTIEMFNLTATQRP